MDRNLGPRSALFFFLSSLAQRIAHRSSRTEHLPPSLARGAQVPHSSTALGESPRTSASLAAPSATNRHRSAASRTPSEHHFASALLRSYSPFLLSVATCNGPAPGRRYESVGLRTCALTICNGWWRRSWEKVLWYSALRIFSSSWWLCDCLLSPQAYEAVWEVTQWGLFLTRGTSPFKGLRAAVFWLWSSDWGWGRGYSHLVEQARFISCVQVMKYMNRVKH